MNITQTAESVEVIAVTEDLALAGHAQSIKKIEKVIAEKSIKKLEQVIADKESLAITGWSRVIVSAALLANCAALFYAADKADGAKEFYVGVPGIFNIIFAATLLIDFATKDSNEITATGKKKQITSIVQSINDIDTLRTLKKDSKNNVRRMQARKLSFQALAAISLGLMILFPISFLPQANQSTENLLLFNASLYVCAISILQAIKAHFLMYAKQRTLTKIKRKIKVTKNAHAIDTK